MKKRIFCILFSLVMCLALLPAMVHTAAATADKWTVMGTEKLTGYVWNAEYNELSPCEAEFGGKSYDYAITFPSVAADKHQFKIANSPAGAFYPEYSVFFTTDATGYVTIYFNSTTKDIAVDAEHEGAPYKPEYITAAGNGDGNWLNGANWDPSAESNKMTEVSSGIWEITYENVEASDYYQVKFAADGVWTHNWGENGAYNSGDNIIVRVAEDGSTVTLRINLKEFDFTSKTGEVTVEVIVTPPGLTNKTVTVTTGAHMTVSSGTSPQSVRQGSAMTDVVIVAEDGYCFPLNYMETVTGAGSGIVVTRNSATQLTVSGTLGTTASDVTITLPDIRAHVDETPKDHLCDNCGITLGTHTGGTATCQSAAICTVCGVPYGATDPNNHVNTTLSGAKSASCTEDGYTGDLICIDCGTTVSVGAAIRAMGHHDWTFDHMCDSCGTLVTWHAGGLATCAKRATCAICMREYGSINPDNHSGLTWAFDENTHWQYCSDCHSFAKFDEGEHNFVDGKCKCGAVRYTVTFDPNGGVVFPTSMVTNVYGTLDSMPTVVHNDRRMQLSGWSLKTDFQAVTQESVYTSDTIVFAVWKKSDLHGVSKDRITSIVDGIGGRIELDRESSKEGSTYTITPDSGYVIDDVLVDGVSVGAVSSYSFADSNENHMIVVSFKPASESAGQSGESGETEKPGDADEPNKTTLPYEDVSPDNPYYEDVRYVYENNLMNGVSENLFGTDMAATRGMFVTVLYRMEDEPLVSHVNSFVDVSDDSYYANAVSWAEANNIINGYGDGTFDPDAAVSKEQAATLWYRYAQYKGVDVSIDETDDSVDATVTDYARNAVQWGKANNIVSSEDGETDYQSEESRGEFAHDVRSMLSPENPTLWIPPN